MNLWRRLHSGHPLLRWSAKVGVFLVVLVLTLFPKVWLLPVWVQRLTHLNSVLDPNHPELAYLETLAWEEELRVRDEDSMLAALRPDLCRVEAVERVVYRAVPYAWDWETWGVMDYLPTVDEVFEKGREDCDGRAVVAASLLRRMGANARLVSDIKHVWVECDGVGLMAPGPRGAALVGGEDDSEATETTIGVETARSAFDGLSFGVAVFPLVRELIILAALCAVLIHPWSSLSRRIVGVALILSALALVRLAGASSESLAQRPALAIVGWVIFVAGALLLAIRAGVKPLRKPASESPAVRGVCPDSAPGTDAP